MKKKPMLTKILTLTRILLHQVKMSTFKRRTNQLKLQVTLW